MKSLFKMLPPNLCVAYAQVCTLGELSCFGLGEDLTNKHIIAATPEVECLIIPRYWILQRNFGNVFTNIRTYLQKSIPTGKDLFKRLMSNRRWIAERRRLIKSLVQNKAPCNTSCNIPLSIRIKEDIDVGVDYE